MLSSGENMMPYLAGRPSFLVDRRWNPDVDPLAPNCPRCDSPNTKFCYYNNYSLSQPRYFCKNCRRYWTKGGSLRNVPVGGGCRKSRRACRSAPRISNSCARVDGVSRECRQPVPNQSSSGSSTVDSSMEESASDGTNIDLALLYSRFLNQSSDDHLGPAAAAAADHVPGEKDDDDESFELRSVIVNSDRHVQQSAADMFPPETQLSNIDLLPAPAGDLGICFDVAAGRCSVPVPTLLPAEGFAYDDGLFWSAGSATCAAGLTQTWHYPPPPPPHDQIPGMAAFQVEDHLQLHSNLYSNSWDMPWA